MKKFIKCIILLCVIIFANSVVSAAEVKQSDDCSYKVVNERLKEAAIVKIDNYENTIKIPANVDGYKIVQIGTDKGDNVINKVDKKVTELIIPEGVRTISKNAFYKTTALKKLQLPNSLRLIDENNFQNAKKLKSIHFKGNINVMNNCFKNVIFDKVVANGDITVGDCCDYEIGAKIKTLIIDCKKNGLDTVYINAGFKRIEKIVAKKSVKTLSTFCGYFDKISMENPDARLSVNFNEVEIGKVIVTLKQPVKQNDGSYKYNWKHNNLAPAYVPDEKEVNVKYRVYEKKAGKSKVLKTVKKPEINLKKKGTYYVEVVYGYKDI